MNLRLALLFFFYITFSTPLCANDEVSSKFVKCAEIVLNGLVHCSEKIGTFAYAGLINSPEITKGAATLIVSGTAIYGTYKAVYVIPAFFKYVKDSVSNLAFFPGRVAETNENVKLSVDKLNDLEIQVDGLKKTVLSYGIIFNKFKKYIVTNFESINEKQKNQTELLNIQADVLNRVDQEVKKIHQEVICSDGKIDELKNQVKNVVNKLRSMEELVSANNTILHKLDVVNIPESIAGMEIVVGQMCEYFAQANEVSSKNDSMAIVQGGRDGKEKERVATKESSFSNSSRNVKVTQFVEQAKISEQKHQSLESKVNDTDRKLDEIKVLLVQSLAAKDDEIKHAQDLANNAKQELVQYQVFVKLLEIGVNQKMEVEAKKSGYVYINPNRRSISQSPAPQPVMGFSRGRSASVVSNSLLLSK